MWREYPSGKFPWQLAVRFSDDEKRFLEDLCFLHGGIAQSVMVRQIIKEKREQLECPIHVVDNNPYRISSKDKDKKVSGNGAIRTNNPR